eukprot:gnl/Ergobibamus_cyprinoides/570.p1 GENE.gnl/Ergobibamus_cyprinoides/570~~gnl/Ergobibamus_cyprinoides/570.p1  ORF type:complete len:128 (-),score=22.27 gnl/Ergobibamus_cyprinoides/570:69-452(-)
MRRLCEARSTPVPLIIVVNHVDLPELLRRQSRHGLTSTAGPCTPFPTGFDLLDALGLPEGELMPRQVAPVVVDVALEVQDPETAGVNKVRAVIAEAISLLPPMPPPSLFRRALNALRSKDADVANSQ